MLCTAALVKDQMRVAVTVRARSPLVARRQTYRVQGRAEVTWHQG